MTTVSLVEDIAMKVAALPIELQREVLNFIEFISLKADKSDEGQVIDSGEPAEEQHARRPVRSIIGCLEDRDININLEDIAEIRHEMWANFPREFPK